MRGLAGLGERRPSALPSRLAGQRGRRPRRPRSRARPGCTPARQLARGAHTRQSAPRRQDSGAGTPGSRPACRPRRGRCAGSASGEPLASTSPLRAARRTRRGPPRSRRSWRPRRRCPPRRRRRSAATARRGSPGRRRWSARRGPAAPASAAGPARRPACAASRRTAARRGGRRAPAEPGALEQLVDLPARARRRAAGRRRPRSRGSPARSGRRTAPRWPARTRCAPWRAAHRPRLGLEQPDERLQAGGLAGPVPADDDRDPGRVDRHASPRRGPAARPQLTLHVLEPPAHAARRLRRLALRARLRLPAARGEVAPEPGRSPGRARRRRAAASSPSGCHSAEIGVAFSITPRLIWMK